jgi:hypothetical protein
MVKLFVCSTKSKYGDRDEKFVYTQALVFVQCFVNSIFAKFSKLSSKMCNGAGL